MEISHMEAFEAAYEDITSNVPGVREVPVTEIAKMSIRSIGIDLPPIHLKTLAFIQSLVEKDFHMKDKKKKGGAEKVTTPTPAYFLWCKDQWNEVKKANLSADFKEVSNILGAKWKTISPKEKKPYEEKYQADKEAYLVMKLLEDEKKIKTTMELLEQYMQFKQEAEEDTKKTKKEKDPLKPKQPMSTFFVFSNERRVDLLGEGKNILEISKITREEWKNMTEQQKKPYKERAKENKYLQEMEIFKQRKEEEEANMKRDEEEHMLIPACMSNQTFSSAQVTCCR